MDDGRAWGLVLGLVGPGAPREWGVLVVTAGAVGR